MSGNNHLTWPLHHFFTSLLKEMFWGPIKFDWLLQLEAHAWSYQLHASIKILHTFIPHVMMIWKESAKNVWESDHLHLLCTENNGFKGYPVLPPDIQCLQITRILSFEFLGPKVILILHVSQVFNVDFWRKISNIFVVQWDFFEWFSSTLYL